MFKFDLGQELKDQVTGYQGVCMVRAEYFTGCRHYGVLSHELNKDGEERAWNWLDESRWEAVDIHATLNTPATATSGPYPKGPNN